MSLKNYFKYRLENIIMTYNKHHNVIPYPVLFILVMCIGFYFTYPYLLPNWEGKNNTKSQRIQNYSVELLNKILSNPNEYANKLFLDSLTNDEKEGLINALDREFILRCKNLTKKCDEVFLTYFIDIKTKLGVKNISPDTLIFLKAYENIKNKYNGTLTEWDLSRFLIPYLVRLCSINFLTEEEKSYWTKKIIDVNKTQSSTTDIQIFYLSKCENIIKADELNEYQKKKVCSVLPKFEDVNKNEPCFVADYLRVKNFCGIKITDEERKVVEDLLSKNYTSNYLINCKRILKTHFEIATGKE